MPMKEQILEQIEKYPRQTIKTYARLLYNANRHTTEIQFYILEKRYLIKRTHQEKYFKNDRFQLTALGIQKLKYFKSLFQAENNFQS